ncbi:nitrite/sulfite reductase [Veillonella sp.]|uniref:nitrite/sulfite reductase n=1 Tax=Veillonella sp. TaxID=1926307 RepID=UPI001B79FCDD|nr:nitrite/sulfite reductase [Veillonella sp.]MBP9551858.1 nitrite/sulfite reductase [Veillonella sp.]
MISEDIKYKLMSDFSDFQNITRKFYNKEISVAEYKGLSGKFGSYAERGGNSSMCRWRFEGGRILPDQMKFMFDMIRRYNLGHMHFTLGQSIQFHRLNGETVLALYEACSEHGIYNRGAGGDNPTNLAASVLRGIDPHETFDISPYVSALSDYMIEQVPYLKLPRKFKVAIDNGIDDAPHATMKDFGFHLTANGTFDVYACGGIGPSPQMGIKVGEDVAPVDILYYVKAMFMVFMNYGNYKQHSKARSRFLPEFMGGQEKFLSVYHETLDMVKEMEQLTINPADYAVPITKVGVVDDAVLNYRIGKQKQEGLYYVEYHPAAGFVEVPHFLDALEYASGLHQVEMRLTPDQSVYIINLTADEAREMVKLLPISAENTFESSISCVGNTICQIGIQDSNGLLNSIFRHLKANDVDTSKLPRLYVSGCPHSCGVHQIGTIGFHGSVKMVDKKPQPGFALMDGGSDEIGTEQFGKMIATIEAVRIPLFIEELANILNSNDAVDYATWRKEHNDEYMALVEKYN